MRIKRLSPGIKVLLGILGTLLLLFLAYCGYVAWSSETADSDDGQWRMAIYQESAYKNLWACGLFYFGDEQVSDLVLEVQRSTGEIASVELSHFGTDKPTDYLKANDLLLCARLLAGKRYTAFADLPLMAPGKPEYSQMTLHWTDADGNAQECQFVFD